MAELRRLAIIIALMTVTLSISYARLAYADLNNDPIIMSESR